MGLKIEVGKAYRDRNGNRIFIEKTSNNCDFPFVDSDGQTYRENGIFYDNDTSEFDLIAPWEDEPSKPKYKAGDILTIEVTLTENEAIVLNATQGAFAFSILHHKIISHKPAPEPEFDWSTVKAGMAFKSKMTGKIYWYVGPRTSDSYILANNSDPKY